MLTAKNEGALESNALRVYGWCTYEYSKQQQTQMHAGHAWLVRRTGTAVVTLGFEIIQNDFVGLY